MKKLLCISLILMIISSPISFGQENNTTTTSAKQWRTPFNKNTKNEFGKREYQYPNPQFGKSSLSISYGVLPITSCDWFASPLFDSKFSNNVRFPSHNTSCIGTISLAYNNQLTPWLELQIPLTYSYGQGSLEEMNSTIGDPKYYDYWFSFTPNIKISWLYNDIFHLYSRIGIGFGIGNRYENFNAGLNHKFAFAWQFSPIGFEVGRRASFFLEAGFGQTGIVTAGLKVRFNKANVKPNGEIKEKINWYDKYVQ